MENTFRCTAGRTAGRPAVRHAHVTLNRRSSKKKKQELYLFFSEFFFSIFFVFLCKKNQNINKNIFFFFSEKTKNFVFFFGNIFFLIYCVGTCGGEPKGCHYALRRLTCILCGECSRRGWIRRLNRRSNRRRMVLITPPGVLLVQYAEPHQTVYYILA